MPATKTLFDVIGSVTSRTEPFHSQALAWFFDESPELTARFVAAFVPESFRRQHGLGESGRPKVRPEDPLATGERVDVSLIYDHALVGIEVKTVDGSSTPGQLERYWQGLSQKYPGTPLFVVYLTPFSPSNVPPGVPAERLHAVAEFGRFEAAHPGCGCHINWQQVVALYDGCAAEVRLGPTLQQHREYIERVVCDGKSMSRVDNARKLGLFLGQEAVQQFFQRLESSGVPIEEAATCYRITLDGAAGEATAVVDALRALLDSEEADRHRRKKDALGRASLRDEFVRGAHGAFFAALFTEVDARPYAWLQGSSDLGVRVAHRNHPGGVSVCTLSPASVEIKKHR